MAGLRLVAPILVAAPLYFAGNLTFGGLMLASGAFMQVQSSLRWFVDNFSTIADWRATLLRVAGFRRAVIETDVMHDVESRIVVLKPVRRRRVRIERSCRLLRRAAAPCSRKRTCKSRRGERRADRRANPEPAKTLLFRALAGLVALGLGNRHSSGRARKILYMPRTPYLPPGTLREVLAYPQTDRARSTPMRLRNALTRARLGPAWCRMLDSAATLGSGIERG